MVLESLLPVEVVQCQVVSRLGRRPDATRCFRRGATDKAESRLWYLAVLQNISPHAPHNPHDAPPCPWRVAVVTGLRGVPENRRVAKWRSQPPTIPWSSVMVALLPNSKHAGTTCPTTSGRRACCTTLPRRSSLLTRRSFTQAPLLRRRRATRRHSTVSPRAESLPATRSGSSGTAFRWRRR